jgi:hypothetical protein
MTFEQGKSTFPTVAARNKNDGPTYDDTYFQDWINSLEKKLKPDVPALEHQPAFSNACKAVESVYQAKRDAEKLCDEISQLEPVNKDLLDKAKEVVATEANALKESLEVCQGIAGIVLEQKEFRDFLADDYDDGDLVTYVVLKQSGAKHLADWCQRGDEETSQLLGFLKDVDLQRQFLQAGGAREGEYCRAVELYSRISMPEKNCHPVLERLTMAVALELCSPLQRFDPPSEFIDPLQRYVHYEQAFLLGELDPAFDNFTVWELRGVVNCNATNEELGWGRHSLMNYRPATVYMDDPQWRYCHIVRSDVGYNQPEWYKEPRTYDQILSGGGECGPRAWYGRFICKAFGIPTWGVKQIGHAAVSSNMLSSLSGRLVCLKTLGSLTLLLFLEIQMSRWTTKGWMTCFSAGWKVAFWEDRCGLDFQLETQARQALENDATYLKKVMRLEWVAFLHNEEKKSVWDTFLPSPSSPWLALSLMQRKRLVNDMASTPRATRSTLSHNKIQTLLDKSVGQETIGFRFNNSGSVIIIPAASTSKPTKETEKIFFPKSFLGGRQLLLTVDSSVEYTLASDMLPDTPKRYKLTLRLCTVHRHEDPLLLTISSDSKIIGDSVVLVDIPYTMGMWEETSPVLLDFGGPDVTTTTLTVTRQRKQYAISIKDLKLEPA